MSERWTGMMFQVVKGEVKADNAVSRVNCRSVVSLSVIHSSVYMHILSWWSTAIRWCTNQLLLLLCMRNIQIHRKPHALMKVRQSTEEQDLVECRGYKDGKLLVGDDLDLTLVRDWWATTTIIHLLHHWSGVCRLSVASNYWCCVSG